MKTFKCNACDKHFKSLGGFEFHRKGDFTSEHPHYGRRCLSEEELTAKGYKHKEGVWFTPLDEKTKQRLAALRTRA